MAKCPAPGTHSIMNVSIIRGKTRPFPLYGSESSGASIITIKEQPTFLVHSLCATFYTLCFTNTISWNSTITWDRHKCYSVICLALCLPLGQWHFPSISCIGLGHGINSGHLSRGGNYACHCSARALHCQGMTQMHIISPCHHPKCHSSWWGLGHC